MLMHLIMLHSRTDVTGGGSYLPPRRQIPSQSGLFFTLPFLTGTARLAGTALLFTLALLAFAFLSFAFLSFAVLLLALLSGSARFTRFVRIESCVHITSPFLLLTFD
jgi:hypothetical protein